MTVDLVYVWCDDTDSEWRAKRERTAARFGIGADGAGNGVFRYRGGDMLRYSLKSAFLHAPWVRTVFVVVDDDQSLPDWPEMKDARVRIVRHSAIIPSHLLPCFSSDVIEHHIARIPGLADRYLYANDDTFFWESVTPDFFFASDGFPLFRYGARRPGIAKVGERDYRSCLDVADGLLRVHLGLCPGPRSMIGRLPHHNVDAYCRDDVLSGYETFRAEIETELGFPFRNPRLVQRSIYAGYALAKGRGHFRRATFNTNCASSWWRRLLPAWADSLQFSPGKWREAPALIARFHPRLVCFNDGPETFEFDFTWLRDFLEQHFAEAEVLRKGGS